MSSKNSLDRKINNLKAYIQSGGQTTLFADVQADLLTFQNIVSEQLGGGSYPLPNEAEWILYGKDTCPYCLGALEAFQQRGINIVFVDYVRAQIDREKLAQEIFENYQGDQKSRERLAQHHTVPIIFHNGYFIGGRSALERYFTTKITHCMR